MSQGGAEDGRAKPILVAKDSQTSSVAATFVDAKGPTPYAVKYFANFLKSLGYKRVVMQSDGEPSIVALIRPRQPMPQESNVCRENLQWESIKQMAW